jgi:hypothetical protein
MRLALGMLTTKLGKAFLIELVYGAFTDVACVVHMGNFFLEFYQLLLEIVSTHGLIESLAYESEDGKNCENDEFHDFPFRKGFVLYCTILIGSKRAET